MRIKRTLPRNRSTAADGLLVDEHIPVLPSSPEIADVQFTDLGLAIEAVQSEILGWEETYKTLYVTDPIMARKVLTLLECVDDLAIEYDKVK